MITFNVLEGAKIINEKRFSAKKSRGPRLLHPVLNLRRAKAVAPGIESAACQGCCAPVLNLQRTQDVALGAESGPAPGP